HQAISLQHSLKHIPDLFCICQKINETKKNSLEFENHRRRNFFHFLLTDQKFDKFERELERSSWTATSYHIAHGHHTILGIFITLNNLLSFGYLQALL
uniref:Ovule protein n=1 Tax=Ascaris lumbricoides TaxID=6252 RepID=A0A0M3IXU2_ASCLU